MNHQQLVDEVQQLMQQLPEQQAQAVRDFAAFLAERYRSASTGYEPDRHADATANLLARPAAGPGPSQVYRFRNDEPTLRLDNDVTGRYV